MTEFKLRPVDFLVNVNRRKDPYSQFKRWAVGPYEHVFLFLGKVKIAGFEVPLLFESMGRGCCLRSLSERYGEEVVVMRLKPKYSRRIPKILREAIRLASSEKSYYDYLCIVEYILPRIILEKLGLPIPLAWHRDPFMVCSEAVLEIYLRAKVPVLPDNIVPLPGDFVTDSPLLKRAGQGRLSADWL